MCSEQRPVALIRHNPDTSLPMTEIIHHTLMPNETLLFFRDGYNRKFDHKDPSKSYHGDELADINLILSQMEILIRWGQSKTPEFIASPRSETKIVSVSTDSYSLKRGTSRFDIFFGPSYSSALAALEESEQSAQRSN